jgi:phage gp36-like protein
MYVDKAQMIERFGETELIQLTDRDGSAGAIVAAVLERAIGDAQAEIDAYLRTAGYVVPLDPVPELVSRIAADLARYYLYDKQATDEVAKRYEHQVKLLQRIADGDVSLGAGAGGSPGAAQTTSIERVFTRDGLCDF